MPFPIPITPELVGSTIAAIVPCVAYCWRIWMIQRERARQRAAILQCADNPVALAALAKLDLPLPDLKAPTSLLLLAAGAGMLAANASLAAPIMGVELPSRALGASLGAELPARCTPQDCKPPAACVHGHCQAEAKPPEAPSPEPAAPAPMPPVGSGRNAVRPRQEDEAPLGPHSGYARVPWAETMPGHWSPFVYEEPRL